MELTFKTEAATLRGDCTSYYSTWQIAAADRKKFEQTFGRNADYRPGDMLHSLSAQVSYYSGLIQKTPDWDYAGVYADEAISGTKNTRGEFQRMLADCRAGKIDMIITKSI